MRHRLLVSAPLLTLLACSGSGEEEFSADKTAPEIEIDTPQRGALSPSTSIEIAGRVIDRESGIAEVAVNGVAASVAEDGSFSIAVDGGPGITLLETVAVDRAGNRSADARAVLAGELVGIAEPVVAGLVARLSSEAMGGLGDMVADLAGGINWTALARSYNPVAADGGDSCNNYKAYVTSVSHGGIGVGSGAASGGIRGEVSIKSLEVRGYVDWRGFCASGRSNFVITASAYDLGALVAPRLDGGAIAVGLEGVVGTFTNFQLDVSGLPGWVEDRFEGRVRDRLETILEDKVREIVPPLARDFLADFMADGWQLDVLGAALDISIWPTEMEWTAAGGTIALDAATVVAGAESGLYLSSPNPRPAEMALSASGLTLGVADDVLNQLLAGMWTGGVFADAMLPADNDTLGSVLGADVAQASLTMLLPPVASFEGGGDKALLTVGDLMVEAFGPDGEPLARFVVSAEIELTAVAGDGGVRIKTDTARILAQVLEQSPTLVTELTSEKIAVIADIAIKQLAGQADGLLQTLPIPGLDASITPTAVAPAGGYLLLGGELQF
jgi:hypothetical protein